MGLLISLGLVFWEGQAGKTRQRIQHLAVELGYSPNHVGRALQMRRSLLVGYLLPAATESFYPELIRGISEVVVAEGYGLLLSSIEKSIQCEQAQLELLRQKCVDGLIVSYYHRDTIGSLARFENEVGPIVICDWQTYDPAVPEVRVDDAAAIGTTTEHLLDLGHERLAYCFGGSEYRLARFQASATTASSRQIVPPSLCETPDDLARLLGSPQPPTQPRLDPR